jgi:hypothetical protein
MALMPATSSHAVKNTIQLVVRQYTKRKANPGNNPEIYPRTNMVTNPDITPVITQGTSPVINPIANLETT